MKLENFSTYQRESRKTWNLVRTDHAIVYPTLGLVNEAGELAGVNTTTEELARVVCDKLVDRIAAGALGAARDRLHAVAVTLHESHVAWAAYEREL